MDSNLGEINQNDMLTQRISMGVLLDNYSTTFTTKEGSAEVK